MLQQKESRCGSVTVEAAIIMPVYITVVFTMIILTKLVYVHALVQQGLVQTVKEMSAYTYILTEILQPDDIHRAIKGTAERNIDAAVLMGKFSDVEAVYNENAELQKKIFNELLDDPGGSTGDFATEGLSQFALEGYKDLVNAGSGLASIMIFPQYVKTNADELDRVMIMLGVEDGLKGVAIKSEFPDGESQTLDLIAVYKINPFKPLNYFLKDLTIVQRAACVPWSGE